MKLRKTKLKQIYKYLGKNKYWLTIAIFALTIIIFHPVNIFKLADNQKKLVDLELQEQYLSTKIEQDSIKLNELKQNNITLEKFAREQYFFHKSNEDVFVIDRSNN
ncbi:MAG: septum formation initiator family protein [Bacteroidales bacterium]|nr:septum formation initiator family protein [Bacteroidales bacterium]